MTSSPRLAIVIPAWKPDFLAASLASLAAQTDSDFEVYVGDDASPHDLASIVAASELGDRCHYVRFADNVGGRDLPAQWERCIDMLRGEEWVWLFSDDDIASPDCVARFRESAARHPAAVFHHFAVRRIDQDGIPLSQPSAWPYTVPRDIASARIEGSLVSFAVEYIFRRDAFLSVGCFPRFDLGWGSDDALWIRLARLAPPAPIPSAYVSWRESQVNISQASSSSLLARKALARIAFLRWLDSERIFSASDPIRGSYASWYFGCLRPSVEDLDIADLFSLLQKFLAVYSCPTSTALRWILDLSITRSWRRLRTLNRRIFPRGH